jgi:hypothetical protein
MVIVRGALPEECVWTMHMGARYDRIHTPFRDLSVLPAISTTTIPGRLNIAQLPGNSTRKQQERAIRPVVCRMSEPQAQAPETSTEPEEELP